MSKFIYQYRNWPNFTWNNLAITQLFSEVKLLQGKIIGQMSTLGIDEFDELALNNISLDIVKSSEIEGETLNYEQVRSSVAKKLGINTAGLINSNRNIEGIVEMMLDATRNFEVKITNKRLYGWHASLFPTGYSGNHKIEVGKYRTGIMQIVSGAIGKEKVHFTAPSPIHLKKEMKQLIDWINTQNDVDGVLKAGIAHFWFIIIHPFDDGNGRIGRALVDYLLAKSENSKSRFYSLSNEIMLQKKRYYQTLEKVQYSSGDITDWLVWFLTCLKNAIIHAEQTIDRIIKKSKFWAKYKHLEINHRQRIMINKLWDGFEGKLQSSKWAKITKSSSDTALRDIKDLMNKGILEQNSDGGRNINYSLIEE